ncbi:MAG TPA: glycosyltransferase family 39 protein [Pantanalinema sp.]
MSEILFAGAVFVSMLGFGVNAIHNPHGGWDAWAIWNLRARFLFRGEAHWTDAFSETLAWSHPDYPLLLPAAIARAWHYGALETQLVPALIGFMFTFATVGLMVWGVGRLRGRSQGLLAGLVLLGTPFFVQHGASQYAEPPLAFYFLATLVLLTSANAAAPSERYRWLFLAALAAGFGAWTKNEGGLFLLVMLLVQGACWVRAKGRRWSRYDLAGMGAGLAGPALLLLAFKKTLAPANDVIGAQTAGTLASHLLDPARHAQIAAAFWEQFNRFGHGMAVGLVVFMLLAGRERSLRGVRPTWAVVGLMLAGYYGVYLITPWNLGWHLATSLDRLFLQLWPCAVFAAMLGARGIAPAGGESDAAVRSRLEGLEPVQTKAT